MELLDIVDENNIVTGESKPRDVVHEQGLYHRHVSCWIMNNKGEILLQKRASIKSKNPNRWAKTGGHVGHGETPIDAAIREVGEEIGVKLNKTDFEFLSLYKSSQNTCFGYEYLIHTDKKIEEFVLQAEEVSEVKYFTIEEIEDIMNKKDKDFTFVDWEDEELYYKTKLLKEKRQEKI